MADPCSGCRKAPAVSPTVTGRSACQRCANRLQGAAAGTILGGSVQGIATGVAAENLTGLAAAFLRQRPRVHSGNVGGVESSAGEVLDAADPAVSGRGQRMIAKV